MIFRGRGSDEVVEHHARQVMRLQDHEARRMISHYKEARQDLQDKLRFWRRRADTFTAQHARGVLAQVDSGIHIMDRQLKKGIGEATLESALHGTRHLTAEIHRFEQRFRGAVTPINVDAVKIATDTKNYLINQYDASINAYSADLRKKITREITHAAIEEIPMDKLVNNIGDFFEGEEWGIRRIARTELHHIYSMAKIDTMKAVRDDTLPDLMKALYHPMDSRTGQDSIELAAENPIIPIDDYFEQDYQATLKSKIQHFRFKAPPNRPNDRAILIPYRESWDSEA
jgi:hypothetical protein